MVFVERASMMGLLGTHRVFGLALFQGWREGLENCWKMCHSNISFQKIFLIFLSCGLLVDILRTVHI